MVRKYKRTSNRAKYGEAAIQTAVREVQAGHVTITRAAQVYNIPYNTLYKRVKGVRRVKSKSEGRPPALPLDVECKLADNIKTMEKWGYGLSTSEVIDKVRQYVTLNQIPNPFK